LLYRVWSQSGPAWAVLSDLNSLTVGTMAQARIAARNGLMPTMFITRVRL
jgi:hypothetical protein